MTDRTSSKADITGVFASPGAGKREPERFGIVLPGSGRYVALGSERDAVHLTTDERVAKRWPTPHEAYAWLKEADLEGSNRSAESFRVYSPRTGVVLGPLDARLKPPTDTEDSTALDNCETPGCRLDSREPEAVAVKGPIDERSSWWASDDLPPTIEIDEQDISLALDHLSASLEFLSRGDPCNAAGEVKYVFGYLQGIGRTLSRSELAR